MAYEEIPTGVRSDEIHTHSFWLYSVIVGLSLEEALRHVLPRLGQLSTFNTSERIGLGLEFIRLALFLCLIVRFYLGGVQFFNQYHVGSKSLSFVNKKYTWDFFSGLVHFSAFLGLSLSISTSRPWWEFNLWLTFIILYDVLWWILCRKHDTMPSIRFWALFNGSCFILSLLLGLLSYLLTFWMELGIENRLFFSQIGFMIPIFLFSLLEIPEVLSSERKFEKWVIKVISRKDK